MNPTPQTYHMRSSAGLTQILCYCHDAVDITSLCSTGKCCVPPHVNTIGCNMHSELNGVEQVIDYGTFTQVDNHLEDKQLLCSVFALTCNRPACRVSACQVTLQQEWIVVERQRIG
jgi:hypothetical protein